ncbi:WD repeat-containing protein 62-like isoform X2 [Periophthalmus magnuspinnatus]|uniref:WD repeat-containing protein 62-like isoform X2 n=1 Tax=Periophthalmus magnuspinnatus TaxID=409849 RepID=UPI00243705A4|nr:WD repeat-containing protein 62-like isoform X2 [Periophthalmus magnuspinnatus]
MAEILEKKKPNVSAGPRRRSRASQPRKSSQTRVRLEQVFGLTASCSSLSSSSGLVAYPAGCVVVLLDPNTNKQSHILNSSRKSFSAVAFSHDGKLLVTGESGHLPCVRVWDLEGALKAEVQTHKYGVSCVAFSRSDVYVVSVGFQHDMNVHVWDWKKGVVIASNKVSSRVSSVSFSEDGSFFVTAGTRHLKFWYLHQSAHNRVNSTVPLIGRSALLGDHKNSVFVAVACGRGDASSRTFCITSSALLCVFNGQRTLEAWVNLKAEAAFSLAVVEDMVFCGCSNGVVRVFSSSLSYICTLQRPHRLGVELQHSASPGGVGGVYPDAVALSFDPGTRLLCVVYGDHSLYCHDLRDLKDQSKIYSALYHSACVWSMEIFPVLECFESCFPPGSFLSSSSDGSIRVWSTERPHSNGYSQDLLRILYIGESDSERSETGADGKSGLRVLAVSPDGAHLATGDRHGNVSVLGLEFMEELHRIEAHNSDVLCLTFSPQSSGVRLLASASRDRLIHIFNRDQDYSLIQSLYDHSGSITAVRFTGESPDLKMVSCGADKSIYVQTTEQTGAGLTFSRCHHVVEKSSLYDMDLDSTGTNAAFACQDRNIRVYSVDSGKLTKTLKGSSSDEGALLKVTFDPSGSYVASSGSDKSICIHDYESGECVATLYGHSEIVTSIRFSADCRHLLTASGDSCIFVWRLDSSMTSLMRKRRGLDRKQEKNRKLNIRRETFITAPSNQISLLPEGEESEVKTPGRPDMESELPPLLQTNGKLPLWFRKLQGEGGAPSALGQSDAEPQQVRRRWAEQMNPIRICSSFSPSPTQNQDQEQDLDRDVGPEEEFCPQSLESLLVEDEGGEEEEEQEEEQVEEEGEEPPGVIRSSFGLFPDHSASDRDFDVQGHQGHEAVSPDSACSDGSTERNQDTDCESLSSSSGSGLVLEENPLSLPPNIKITEERFDTDPRTLQPPDPKHFLQPRLSLSTRFLSRYQDRIRSKPQTSVSSRILEESSIENVKVEPQTNESSLKSGSLDKSEFGLGSKSTQDSGSQRLSDGFRRSLPPQGLLGNVAPLRKSQGLNQDLKPGLTEDKTSGLNQRLWDRGKENLNPGQDQEPDPSPDLNPVSEDLNPISEGLGLIPCGAAEEQSGNVSVAPPPGPVAPPPGPVASPPASLAPPPGSVSPPPVSLAPPPGPVCPPPVSLAPPPDPVCPPPVSLAPPPGPVTPPPELHTVEQEEADDVTSCPAPECDRPRPPPGEQEVMQMAQALRRTTEETIHLYRQVSSNSSLASLLLAALEDSRSRISGVCDSAPHRTDSAPHRTDSAPHTTDGAPCVHPELCSCTVSLLERYSERLLQITRDKLN